MVQIGKYRVGYKIRNVEKSAMPDLDTSQVAIYKDDSMICSFSMEEAKEVTKLMMVWCNLSAVNELSDNELIDALRERGYRGNITVTQDIKL